MPNSTKTQTKVVGTTIDAMIKEGKALATIWKQTNSLKASTKASGFDTRLGKLLQQLKASSPLDSGQISRQTLTTHGVHIIDRRRRSEALWFVENEVDCREFMKSSKKGFTSLSALQRAAREAAKANTSSKEEDTNSEADNSEAERSDVGPSEDKPKVVVTKTLLVNTILQQAEINKIDLEEVIMDLMEAQERKNQKVAA